MSSGYFHERPEIALDLKKIQDRQGLLSSFSRPAPIEVEIGSGKGTFLVSQARAYPDTNFLGIEYTNKVYRYAVDRMSRWGLTNVRIIRTEAVDFIRNFIPDASIQAFHIYYPDPWPKKRHHKRRFFNSANLDQLVRCLVTGGRIQLATDHEDYWRQIDELIAAASDRVSRVDFSRPAGALDGEVVGTNYERKYRKASRPVFFVALVKTT